ncbi:type VI secretion system protein ImpL [Robbsia andropogonis]|uniref:type VI secretion system protein n=1 Tax=Robbsia andropogonis TaxID=28092 RepID=UPI003D1BC6AF
MNSVSAVPLLSSLPGVSHTVVIGAVVSGIVLLAALIVAMLAYRKKRRESRAAQKVEVAPKGAPTPTEGERPPAAAGSKPGETPLAHVLRGLRRDFRARAGTVDARTGTPYMRYDVPCLVVLNASPDAKPLPLSNLDVTPWVPNSATDPLAAENVSLSSRLLLRWKRWQRAKAFREGPETPAMPGMTWTFADRGVVIELRQPLIDFVPSSGMPGQPQPVWDTFLRCSSRYRPRRPLDAVVLVLPARLLRDDSVQGHLALQEAAQLAHQRLWHLQRLFAMRVTVYVVISECESIPGFDAFARSLSEPARQSMVGWSSPYSPDRLWDEKWVDEALNHLGDVVNASVVAHFAASIDGGEMERIVGGCDRAAVRWLALLDALSALRQPLHRYMEALMRPNAYHDPFLLRGLYWGGDIAGDAAGAESDNARSEPVFYRDLLLRKAFAEIGLTRASATVALRSRSGHRLMRWGATALLCGWAAGLGVATWQTAARGKVLADVLRGLRGDQRMMAAAAQRQEWLPVGWYSSKTLSLLALDETLAGPLARVTMPGVWLPFDRLDARISDRFHLVFGAMAVVAFERELGRKVHALTGAPMDPLTGEILPMAQATRCDASLDAGDMVGMASACNAALPAVAAATLAPFDRPAMRDLLAYLKGVEALEQALGAWKRLRMGDNASKDADEDFRSVIRYLMNVEVRGDVAHSLRRFSRYSNKTQFVPSLKNPALRAAVQRRWQIHAVTVRHDLLSANCLLSTDKRVQAMLQALGQGVSPDGGPINWPVQYAHIVSLLDDEATMVAGGGWRWILDDAGRAGQPISSGESANRTGPGSANEQGETLALPPVGVPRRMSDEIDEIAGRVSASTMLGAATASAWRDDWWRAQRGLQSDLRQWLANPKSGLLWNASDATWHLKPARIALRGALGNLMEQSFMTSVPPRDLPAPAPGQVLRWRLDRLAGPEALDDARKQLLAKTVLPLSPDLAQDVTRGADKQLAALLLRRLADAAQLVPVSVMADPASAAGRSSAPAVQIALKQIADSLTLLDATPAVQQLQERLSADAMSWLQMLDQRLNASDLYAVARVTAADGPCGPMNARVESDRVVPVPSMACAFAVRTQSALASFVGEQSATIVDWGGQATTLLPLLTTADANTALARKWRGIVEDLARYAVRSPMSSLLQLEQFILAAGPPGAGAPIDGGACARLASTAPRSASQDYFSETQWRLYRWLSTQCQAASSMRRRADWRAFQTVFNTYLAGHSPFASPLRGSGERQPEAADPSQVARALMLFRRFKGATVSAGAGMFDGNRGSSVMPSSVGAFARQFDMMSRILTPLTGGAESKSSGSGLRGKGGLPANDGPPEPSLASAATAGGNDMSALVSADTGTPGGLGLKVAFRVNKQLEQYGNQIIDWTFASGAQRVSKQRDALPAKASASLAWRPGDPIVLTLRLADEAQIRIGADPRQPAMATDGRTVIFRFDDTWALLSMIDRHRASTGTDGITLAFSFPVTPCVRDETMGCRAPLSKAALAAADALRQDAPSGPSSVLNARVFIGLTLLQAGGLPPDGSGSIAGLRAGDGSRSVATPRAVDWPAQRPSHAPAW